MTGLAGVINSGFQKAAEGPAGFATRRWSSSGSCGLLIEIGATGWIPTGWASVARNVKCVDIVDGLGLIEAQGLYDSVVSLINSVISAGTLANKDAALAPNPDRDQEKRPGHRCGHRVHMSIGSRPDTKNAPGN